jgi:hypothetical protein
LLSTIQADNIRFALSGAGFDGLRPRKRGPSMLTLKNKAEECRDHPTPKNKFTIWIVQAEEFKELWLFCCQLFAWESSFGGADLPGFCRRWEITFKYFSEQKRCMYSSRTRNHRSSSRIG